MAQRVTFALLHDVTYGAEEVDASEAAEVLLVNSLAPFVLNSKLVPLMAATAAASARGAYVVNVSAMEVWPTEGTSRFALTATVCAHVGGV